MRKDIERRARLVHKVMVAGRYFEGLRRAGDTMKAQGVRDLLADIRHFCDVHGIDFAEQDRQAEGHYSVEASDALALVHAQYVADKGAPNA